MSLRATLTRHPGADEGTFGRFETEDGALALLSLELPWRDLNGDGIGDPQRSCITPGTYQCVWQESPKFGWCYEVTGVQGRSRILIHPANFAGDVQLGWQSDLLGCIALGYAQGHLGNKQGKRQRALVRDEDNRGSKAAIAALHGWAKERPFTLTIL